MRGPLWRAIQRYNARGVDRIDVVRVGDVEGPPLGIDDPARLLWAEQAGRILVTLDEQTMPTHLAAHLANGRTSPGVLTIRAGIPVAEALEFLVLAALASEPSEWQNRIAYVP